MLAHITFERGRRCAHDAERECSPCFKSAMVPFFDSEEDFDAMWRTRCLAGPDDLVDNFAVYFTDDEGEDPALPLPLVMRPR